MEKKITGKESLELEKNISGKERRKQILELIRQSVVPLSGAKLGQLTGRQPPGGGAGYRASPDRGA